MVGENVLINVPGKPGIFYGVALPSSNTSLLHSINNEIMQLKVSGDIDQILGRWIPKESVSNRVFQNFLLGFLVLCIFATGVIVIFAKFNAYLKEQVACKTQSLQLLNEDLQKQILTVRNTNELRMLLIENNAEGVVVFTRENRITIFNEKALRVTQLKYAPIGLDVFQVPLLDQLLEDVKSHIYSPVFVRALPGTSFGQRLASVKVTRLYIKIALTGSSSGGAAAGSLQKSAPSGWTGRFLGDTSYRQAL